MAARIDESRESAPGITACAEIVDSHLHVWDPTTGDYPWISPALEMLNRTFGAEDLESAVLANGVAAGVLVQAADSTDDSERMRATCMQIPDLDARIVGWLPLETPVLAQRHLENCWERPLFTGVRHMIHGDPDGHWLARPSVRDGLELLVEHGLSFDLIAAGPGQLIEMVEALEVVPDLRVIVNHLGSPGTDSSDGRKEWKAAMIALAEHPYSAVKLSGWSTQTDPENVELTVWQAELDLLMDHFGAGRLMWGSDWPVSILAGDYAKHLESVSTWTGRLNSTERDAIMGGSARRIYWSDGRYELTW